MSTLIESIKTTIERAAGISSDATARHKLMPPPNPQLGDLASNIALLIASASKQKPLEVAQRLAQKLTTSDLMNSIEVVAPGFLNLRLSGQGIGQFFSQALEDTFGHNSSAKGNKARVEFISANPTGPLHIGNARGGPLGDTIANVLQANGYEVLREYINNDRGNQVKELGESIVGRGTQYRGEYVKELKSKIGGISDPQEAGQKAVEIMFEEIIADSRKMGISFDYIVHESQLQQKAAEVLQELDSKGLLKEKEGALWFVPGGGDELEAVVRKSDGSYLYFTADVVYHRKKFLSGYDLVIDVLGSNTFGHVPKLKALAKVYGFDLERFKVVLYQFVRVKRGKEVASMSKRAGTFVTAREVLEEVGKDAFRFFLLMSDPNTHVDFDLELAKAQGKENPVYYIQYALARINSIFGKAGKLEKLKSHLSISNEKERQLLLNLLMFPDLIQEIGETLAVHKLTHYALKIAGLFHDFYETERVLDQDSAKRQARLALCQATHNVLAGCLTILGISIPKKM